MLRSTMSYFSRFVQVVFKWIGRRNWFRSNPISPTVGLELGKPLNWNPYIITQPFGCDNGNLDHGGIDYAYNTTHSENEWVPPTDVEVLCMYRGRVDRIVTIGDCSDDAQSDDEDDAQSDEFPHFGCYVRVRSIHNNQTFFMWYCHLSGINDPLIVGQPILKGHIIGNVGASGHAHGVHLHVVLEAPGFGFTGNRWYVQNVLDFDSLVDHDGWLLETWSCD